MSRALQQQRTDRPPARAAAGEQLQFKGCANMRADQLAIGATLAHDCALVPARAAVAQDFDG
jgi:hypothetical protein